mgnify:CR=1 FL=1
MMKTILLLLLLLLLDDDDDDGDDDDDDDVDTPSPPPPLLLPSKSWRLRRLNRRPKTVIVSLSLSLYRIDSKRRRNKTRMCVVPKK